METTSCPTIVFCLQPTGIAIGESIAAAACNLPEDCPLFLWAVHPAEETYTAAQIAHLEGTERAPEGIVNGTVGSIVSTVIAQVLSLADSRIPPMMERPVSLRLSLLAATWEIAPSLVSSFVAAFSSYARQHVGTMYLAEACLMLPGLAPSAPPDADEIVNGVLGAVEPEGHNSDPGEGVLSYCWWFDSINGSGVTVPSLPSSTYDIATVTHALLTSAPEHLPRSLSIISGRPQHMSVGYGELFASREMTVEILTARYACRLIEWLFLHKASRADLKRARRRAWLFALSSECGGALREIEFTAGGKQIWEGFHPAIPERVVDGDVDDFLFNLRDSLDRFLKTDLLQLRREFELSGHKQCEALNEAIEVELKDIMERTSGGLFEASAFLEELGALSPESADLSEGETLANLQEMRRGFDLAFAVTLHMENLTFPKTLGSTVRSLRHQLAQLRRLKNISEPPAVGPRVFQALKWSADGKTLDQSIEALSKQLDVERASWAQSVADVERKLQNARYNTEPEEKRRDQHIEKEEDALRQAADQCKALIHEIARYRAGSYHGWFDRLGRDRDLKEKNSRLGHLQSVILPRQARQVINAYRNRMQLSIDRAIYEVRDDVIQHALAQVRERYRRAVGALDFLNSSVNRFRSLRASPSKGVLRRSIIADADLDTLLDLLTKGLDLPNYPSAWDVFSEPAESLERILEAARKPFAAVRNWKVPDFLRFLHTDRTKVDALVQWLKHITEPLLPSAGEQTIDYSIVCANDDPALTRLLRHAFPEAAWIDSSRPAVSVLRLRHIAGVYRSVRRLSTTVEESYHSTPGSLLD